MPDAPPKPAKRKTVPRKMSRQRLANIARYHLERFSTTVAHLRQVLTRRVNTAIRAHGGDKAVMAAWVEEVLSQLVASGALDDARYAAGKAASLRRKGKATARIQSALRAKGVPAPVAAAVLADEAPEDSETAYAAALAYATRRRLGPFRPAERTPGDLNERRQRWQKDLAAMVRAGFSYDVARRVFAQTR
jgi:regulatory protein